MRKIDRFLKYLESKGINENRATIECDLSQGILSQAKSGKSDLGSKTIDKILKKYQDLSRVWLITGEGEMLISNDKNTKPSNESSVIEAILLTLEIQREGNKRMIEQMDRISRTNEELVKTNNMLVQILGKRGLAEDASGAAKMAVAVQG